MAVNTSLFLPYPYADVILQIISLCIVPESTDGIIHINHSSFNFPGVCHSLLLNLWSHYIFNVCSGLGLLD